LALYAGHSLKSRDAVFLNAPSLPSIEAAGSKGSGTGAVAQECLREAYMANTASAKKATRKIARRTEINKARRSRMRSFIRKVEEAIASGDKTAAETALKAAQPELQRAATKGVLHRNTASRKVSRLAQRVKSIGA
jgi:small subunit ribosomal protein S20